MSKDFWVTELLRTVVSEAASMQRGRGLQGRDQFVQGAPGASIWTRREARHRALERISRGAATHLGLASEPLSVSGWIGHPRMPGREASSARYWRTSTTSRSSNRANDVLGAGPSHAPERRVARLRDRLTVRSETRPGEALEQADLPDVPLAEMA